MSAALALAQAWAFLIIILDTTYLTHNSFPKGDWFTNSIPYLHIFYYTDFVFGLQQTHFASAENKSFNRTIFLFIFFLTISHWLDINGSPDSFTCWCMPRRYWKNPKKLIHERKKLNFSQISNAAVGHANDGGDGCNESRRTDLVNLAGLSAAPSWTECR